MKTKRPRKQRPASSAPRNPSDSTASRLQKLLAGAGVGSRRHCEELILTGRVQVDGQTVTELGSRAESSQEIRVDGVPLARPRQVYFAVNKPTGVVSTNSDPAGRMRVIDLVDYTGRLFTIGRLDMHSEGLIVVTNDGELANRLTHPRYGVEKSYQVEVAGVLDKSELEPLRRGIHLAEGRARVVSAKVIRHYHQSTLVEIVLNEGRNREIRRLLARIGHKVERLRRVAIGPLRLADLPRGHVRMLTRDEVRRLRQAAQGIATRAVRKPKPAVAKPQAAAKAPQRSVIGGDVPRPGKRPGTRPGKSAGGSARRTAAGRAKSKRP